jgi:hypothetical protein
VTSTACATVTGAFLRTGVSRNGRLYTAETIRRAVARMQARLDDPKGQPLAMLSHHAAGDDSLRIVGRVTAVEARSLDRDDVVATFAAEIANTTAGRDVAALVATENAGSFLRNVSIRGWWLGDVRTEQIDGQTCETADDLEIDGIDFTKSPGLPAARIDTATLLESHGRHVVTESAELSTVERLVPLKVLLGDAPRIPAGEYGESSRQTWAAVAEALGADNPFWRSMRQRQP